MNVTERFLRYVTFDTKSDEFSETCPSTDKQRIFGAALVEEMKEIGIQDAYMDENGYVYGTVPGDPRLPTIGLVFSNTTVQKHQVFVVHVVLKPGLENSEHYFTSV